MTEMVRQGLITRRQAAMMSPPSWPPGSYQPTSGMPMAGPPSGFTNPLEDELRIPDYTEPIIAWRAWAVHDDERWGVILRSVTHRVRWPIKKSRAARMRAHCLARFRAPQTAWSVPLDHPGAPNIKHGCGLYAVKTREQALKWASGSATKTVGRVALWGDVKLFTQGYLAEYALPLSLVDVNGAPEVAEARHRYRLELE